MANFDFLAIFFLKKENIQQIFLGKKIIKENTIPACLIGSSFPSYFSNVLAIPYLQGSFSHNHLFWQVLNNWVLAQTNA
jgi:hypothetical protein